jgi:hypothetical protein
MRIDEFTQKDNTDLPFDIVDDMAVYMRNDPMFYRKEYLPVVFKMKDMIDSNQAVNGETMFTPVIEKGINSYCRRYDVGRRPEELLSDDELKGLVEKLYSEEISSIKKGVYK